MSKMLEWKKIENIVHEFLTVLVSNLDEKGKDSLEKIKIYSKNMEKFCIENKIDPLAFLAYSGAVFKTAMEEIRKRIESTNS